MPSQYAEFVKAHYSDVKDLPAKERFAALAKMWNKQKVNTDDKDIKQDKVKADKPKKEKAVKAKAVKAKGGAFVQGVHVPNVLDKLKSLDIPAGGFQQFPSQRPQAINQSTLQQLIKKQ